MIKKTFPITYVHLGNGVYTLSVDQVETVEGRWLLKRDKVQSKNTYLKYS